MRHPSSRIAAEVANGQHEPLAQQLTLLLERITAGDYLTWVRDPEPRAFGHHLKSVTAQVEPLGGRVDMELV
jgi:hypothetical protein